MLKADGWIEIRQTGSHKRFSHPTKPGKVTVAASKGDFPPKTLRRIYEQAGWDWSKRP